MLGALLLQVVAAVVLLIRLVPGRRRLPPAPPVEDRPADRARVSVVVATLNEAERIGPCLAGLARQGATMREVLVVDSRSTDGTADLVTAAGRGDPRIRVVTDDPLPAGWVGKVWALQHGLSEVTGEWVLGIDADTEPLPGMVQGVLAAAEREGYDAVSFGPRFAGQVAAERWLQPALLTTLVYRFGAPGAAVPPDRVMANGQCFLARRDVLLRHGGYSAARASWADDVTLARHLAAQGASVGFLDGSRLIIVRAYRSAGEMWREWGRSIDVTDGTTVARQWIDVAYLALVQAAPVPVLLVVAGLAWQRGSIGAIASAAVIVNAALFLIRVCFQLALAPSYTVTGVAFWLAPLADPLAVLRIVLSTLRRPTRWRGRRYGAGLGQPSGQLLS